METTIRYSQLGHKFIIEGEMVEGNTINVYVEPLPGYVFVSWADDNTDNPRTITIDKCGVNFVANIVKECNEERIFNTLVKQYICDIEHAEYEESGISCEEITDILGEIIGNCEKDEQYIISTNYDDTQVIIDIQ